MVLQQILQYNFLNNSVYNWLIALGVFIAVLIILKVFKNIGIDRLKKLSQKTKTDIDDLIIKIIGSLGGLFYFMIALYISLRFVNLSRIIDKIVYYALIIVLTYYAVRLIQAVIDFTKDKMAARRQAQDEQFEPHTINLLSSIIKAIVWIFAVVILLQNLGYNITTLAAGLGIGGIAIAFALQNVLTDIFASFSIYFDKPFQIGDFIIIGKDMGTVEKIGIKSTRIRTLQGQELVVSNKELTETRVNNYKKMERRRITFNFAVEYNTPADKLRKIPEMVKKIIESIDSATFDRCHFKELGDFSLNFENVYYMELADYDKYMDVQEAINLALIEEFSREKIEFAYPSQTVYLSR